MPRREPFTQTDIKARKGEHERFIEAARKSRNLINLAEVEPERGAEFTDQIIDEIATYRLIELARRQERPAAVAAAMQNLIEECERPMRNTGKFPASVRASVGIVGIGEPTEAAVVRARGKVAQMECHVVGHRGEAVTPSLMELAHTLQIIACQFSSSLKSDSARRKRWLEKALTVAGEKSPGKNQKKKYFDKLMLSSERIDELFALAEAVRRENKARLAPFRDCLYPFRDKHL